MSTDPGPVAVVENKRIVTLNDAAASQGARVGMNFEAARALAPELQAWPRHPLLEAAFVERLALALSCYTSSVVLRDDAVLLEVSASLRLFGGIRALGAKVLRTAGACGVGRCLMVAAPTATAAEVLARVEPNLSSLQSDDAVGRKANPAANRKTNPAANPKANPAANLKADPAGRRPPPPPRARLDVLPLPAVLLAWQQPAALAQLLHGIGCRTLGDVHALPRVGLKRRGGQALMNAVERAYGEAPDPQAWYQSPPHFELGLELLHRADNATALVFAAQRLVQPLAGWLTQRWLAASRLSLHIEHQTEHRRARADTVLTLTLGEPSREADAIMLLLRERLQRLALPAPAHALRLRLDESVAHAGRRLSFWRSADTRRDGEVALIDRLSARLGAEQVQRAELRADHRPEQAMGWVIAQRVDLAGTSPTPGASAGSAPNTLKQINSYSKHYNDTSKHVMTPRPAWLLTEPLALQERHHRPLHQGVALCIVSRAERIEAGWFDGPLASRDYHLAIAADHRCLWVFREHRADRPPRWFLHGIFG